MTEKIVVPSAVAEAIRHYTDLADTKTEAFTDILSLGYEAERSEIILRHFDHDYDELMQALICGYTVEKTPEHHVKDYVDRIQALAEQAHEKADHETESEFLSEKCGAIMVLNLLGIKISGVNADD
jgi:DNA integrity scanning protein DisA with diadenylate cyclase activity